MDGEWWESVKRTSYGRYTHKKIVNEWEICNINEFIYW